MEQDDDSYKSRHKFAYIVPNSFREDFSLQKFLATLSTDGALAISGPPRTGTDGPEALIAARASLDKAHKMLKILNV